MNQKLALRQLQKLGYTAHPVGNGAEVLHMSVAAPQKVRQTRGVAGDCADRVAEFVLQRSDLLGGDFENGD